MDLSICNVLAISDWLYPLLLDSNTWWRRHSTCWLFEFKCCRYRLLFLQCVALLYIISNSFLLFSRHEEQYLSSIVNFDVLLLTHFGEIKLCLIFSIFQAWEKSDFNFYEKLNYFEQYYVSKDEIYYFAIEQASYCFPNYNLYNNHCFICPVLVFYCNYAHLWKICSTTQGNLWKLCENGDNFYGEGFL